jgi:hypothetical protein
MMLRIIEKSGVPLVILFKLQGKIGIGPQKTTSAPIHAKGSDF